MNINLLIPNRLSISNTLKEGFEELNHKVKIINYQSYVNNYITNINNQIYRAPNIIKKRWYALNYNIIENCYKQLIHDNPAELYLVYNSQMLTPKVISLIKKSGGKLFTIMGDSPYYTKTNSYYIDSLINSDYIFSLDTYWIEQLKMLGLKNVEHLVIGYNPKIFKNIDVSENFSNIEHVNCVFMGLNYDSLLGYKRSLFLSKFVPFGLRIYGDKNWLRWIEKFTELKSSFIYKKHFISDEDWNLICNYSKIHPIDANPGLTNGIHIRVFDSIGSGILPIAEYRRDMDIVFPNKILPTIKSYNDIKDITNYYLDNDNERRDTVVELKKHISSNYSNVMACKQILSHYI